MITAGLTGGIASGKSHVLRRFADAGFATVDLDTVAHEVMAPGGAAFDAVVAAFGAGILAADGTIDRKALGARVFADPRERRRLEALVHPRVREAEVARLAGRAPDSVAVVDAALLVETGQHLRFARLVVVFCEPDQQLRRLMARDGLSRDAAAARLDAQMAPAEKRQFAHFVIDNSGDRTATDAQTAVVATALRSLAPRPATPVQVSAERAAALIDSGPARGPGGLSPWDCVSEIAASGTLDLARLAARIDPGHDGPWHTLRPGHAELATSLAFPVALWSLAQHPGDEPYAVAAAASVSRLIHRDPTAIAGAIVAVLAAVHALQGADAGGVQRGLPHWRAAASAWAGAAPPAAAGEEVITALARASSVSADPARVAQVARLLSRA